MFNQPIPPITKNLLIINVLFFLATYILGSRGIDLYTYLAAFYPESVNFHPWQIITHMFMHGDIGHLIFNMFALWMFGSVVETSLGSKRFIILYFLAGLGSFALFNYVNYLQVSQLKETLIGLDVNINEFIQNLKFDGSGTFSVPVTSNMEAVEKFAMYYISPMVGASGAIYGILIAFGVLYPNAKLALIFFPVPVKAKYFMPIMIVAEFFMGLQNYSWDPIAHFAHLGGALIGFILVRYWKKNFYRTN